MRLAAASWQATTSLPFTIRTGTRATPSWLRTAGASEAMVAIASANARAGRIGDSTRAGRRRRRARTGAAGKPIRSTGGEGRKLLGLRGDPARGQQRGILRARLAHDVAEPPVLGLHRDPDLGIARHTHGDRGE